MGKDSMIVPDGPTSVFLMKRNGKLTLRQRLEKFRYKIKRAYVEKTLKANSHSLDEVMDYIVNVHGFVEMEGEGVRQEYEEMRASSILQYAPELLGEYATMPQLKSESEEDIREYINQSVERQKKAMEIPMEEFDIDFHKFQNSGADTNDNIYIIVEKRFAYIGGGASGNKKVMRRFQKIYKDVHRYYGVTKEDIAKKSKRYEQLVRALIHWS
ncbi:MAG: hypothetical protein IJ282_09155 [Lachnospiraceae bacterium]|nr:hypothetical protein [Lachnospiraceae bacterium]